MSSFTLWNIWIHAMDHMQLCLFNMGTFGVCHGCCGNQESVWRDIRRYFKVAHQIRRFAYIDVLNRKPYIGYISYRIIITMGIYNAQTYPA